MLIQNEQDLWKRQSDSNIKKLEEHMTILLEEYDYTAILIILQPNNRTFQIRNMPSRIN